MRIIIVSITLLFMLACSNNKNEVDCDIADSAHIVGDITGEIHVNNGEEPINGSISLTGNTFFDEHFSTQGKFGQFSLSSTGEWVYFFTDLAHEVVEPNDEFTVTACDGSEHKITILVKGLFQRISSVNFIDLPSEGMMDINNILADTQPIKFLSQPNSNILNYEYSYHDDGRIEHINIWYSDSPDSSLDFSARVNFTFSYLNNQLASLETILNPGDMEIDDSGAPHFVANDADFIRHDFTIENGMFLESEYQIDYLSIMESKKFKYEYDDNGNLLVVNETPTPNITFFYEEHVYLNGKLESSILSEPLIFTSFNSPVAENFGYDQYGRWSYSVYNEIVDDDLVDLPLYRAALFHLEDKDQILWLSSNQAFVGNNIAVSEAALYQYEEVDECFESNELTLKAPIFLPDMSICKAKTNLPSSHELPNI